MPWKLPLKKLVLCLSLLAPMAFVACGDSSHRENGGTAPEAGIMGGTVAQPGQPGMSSVVMLFENGSAFCTGTLIDATTVLTAAHCVDDKRADFVLIGFAAEPGNLIGVRSMLIHAGFVSADNNRKDGLFKVQTKSIHDIAILRLNEAPPKAATFATLQKTAFRPGTKLNVTAYGYGLTSASADGIDYQLRRVTKTATVGTKNPDKLTFDQSDGKGLCHGDSGGPSFTVKNGKAILVGVTSHLDGVQLFFGQEVGDRCRSNAQVLQVGPYVGWIKQAQAKLNSTGGLY